MKRSLLLAALVAMLGIFARPIPVEAQSPVTFDTFFQELAPYGDWVNVEGYGLSWRPRVDENWRPYTDGRWAQTDAGWTWMSNEPWGWITYHYGRWTTLEDRSWIWVPGYEWAPAWVSWRSSDDYVGWAPLPPEAVWEPSKGFSTTVDVSYNIGIQVYNFCPVQYLGWPSLHPVLMPPAQNVTILPTTTNVTTVGVRNNAIYCGGPDSARINRRGEYSIPQYQLQRSQVVGAWPAPAEQQALLKQGVLAVRSPRVYPIFSATTQRSVTTEIPNGRLKPNGRPRSSPAPATQVATQPTPAALPPAATVQNTPVYDVTVGQQQPGQAPAYTVSGFQVARPQQIPSNPQPTPQSDSQPGNAWYRQQQDQQAQMEANARRFQAQQQQQQQQTPPSETEVRVQQQQQQMQDRARQIQEAQQERMRQAQQNQITQQQQQQAEAFQQQREAMQRQLQQQQDRLRQQQQSQQAPPPGSQNHPRPQQTPRPGSAGQTSVNQ